MVTWIAGVLAAWAVAALGLALLLGGMIRHADRAAAAREAVPAHPPPAHGRAGSPRRAVSAPARRRRIPLPPVGVALVLIGTALVVTGYVLRITGAGGRYAGLLSMDAPLSVPRMFIASLFAVAAVAALGGAGRQPGRRTWWTAVAVVTGSIAVVKAGAVHGSVLRALDERVGSAGSVVVSVLVPAGVLAALWWLSRAERRDRTRVLGGLALYGTASVVLSAVSSVVDGRWSAAATLVEETGEACAAAICLVAVLAGVAPRLVLPRSWALRREADAASLDLADALPGRRALDEPAPG